MPEVLPDDAHADWLGNNFDGGANAIAFARDRAIMKFERYAVRDQINRPIGSDASLIEPL